MTLRLFWSIFIKILGIWFVLDSLIVIPQFLSSLSSYIFYEDDFIGGTAVVIGILLITIGSYLFILRLFVFKTNWLINKLHLVKGFEDKDIDININKSTVLKISIIVIGGLIFVEALPQLCMVLFGFFQQKSIFRENPSSSWIVFHSVRTIIGYLLMTNSNSVMKFIEQQTDKHDEIN